MYITRKHLSRRTVLKGAGCAVGVASRRQSVSDAPSGTSQCS